MRKQGMFFRGLRASVLAAVLGWTAASHAAVIGYWDFNNGDLSRSDGTQGSLALSLASFSWETYVSFPEAGTTLNAEPSVPAGRALEFFNLLTIAENGTLTISNLNFSGLSDVTLSFAAEQWGTPGLAQAFSIEVFHDGSWHNFSSFSQPGSSYSLESIDLSSALDGIADAAIRIRFQEVANLVDELRFDNLKVTAVPEPGAGGLLIAGVGLLFFRRRARRG